VDNHFKYWALDQAGRRTTGVVRGQSERDAFDSLLRSGLHPIKLKLAPAGAPLWEHGVGLSEASLSELLHDLGALLGAGADMKAALAILGERSDEPKLAAAIKRISAAVGGGTELEAAFKKEFRRWGDFVGGVLAAGQAEGDLAGSLSRAAQLIDEGIALRRKLVEALSYPAFIGCLALAAFVVIIVVVVPALEPLLREGGRNMPFYMAILLGLSDAVNRHGVFLLSFLVLALVAALVTLRLGWLKRPLDSFWLHGPLSRTACRLVYGSIAITLGSLLAAGVGMADAIRLAGRTTGSLIASDRIETVARAVRDGRSISAALAGTPGFPGAIARLARIGEEAGALGPMLERGGRLERDRAYQAIERVTGWLGPSLIILLGGLIGLLMAGLLGGISQLGEAALS
jgi:general secretion pathway protein F